jgi:hypothetical protein
MWLGRPKVQATEEFKEVYNHWKAGETTAIKALEVLGVKKTTFYKSVKEYERDIKKITRIATGRLLFLLFFLCLPNRKTAQAD